MKYFALTLFFIFTIQTDTVNVNTFNQVQKEMENVKKQINNINGDLDSILIFLRKKDSLENKK